MHKVIKHKWEDRDKLFFSSDWHVFHDPKWEVPIWQGRGYLSPEDAAQKTLEKINERVPEDGIIYYLGDMFLNATDDQCLEWLSKINCKTIYNIFGNHSSNTYRIYKQEVQKQFGRDDIEVYPLKFNNLNFIGDYQEILVGKKMIVLSHYAIHSWNSMARNSWHLAGHSHCDDPSINPDNPVGLMFDSGWDWKKDLWSFEEVRQIMESKTRKIEGHH